MYNEIKESEARKIRDLRLWVQDIQNSIPTMPNISSHLLSDKNTEKGLFFVFAYGIIEYTVKSVVAETIKQLNEFQIDIKDVSYPLYTLVFSKEYDSLYGVGSSKKWENRWKISDKLIANEKVFISNELMPTDGKNIRYKQLESIARSFGVTAQVVPSNEVGGYLDVIVNNRNWIAHGDKLPSDIGRNYSINDIVHYSDITSELCSYIIEIYENYILNFQYLKSSVYDGN